MIINGSIPGNPVEVAKAKNSLSPALPRREGDHADEVVNEVKNEKSSEEKKAVGKKGGRKSTKKVKDGDELFGSESMAQETESK